MAAFFVGSGRANNAIYETVTLMVKRFPSIGVRGSLAPPEFAAFLQPVFNGEALADPKNIS